MTTLLLALALADIARCESSRDFRDGAAEVDERHLDDRRGGFAALTRPGAFAIGCPLEPRRPAFEHLVLGLRGVLGIGKAPRWAKEARFFCAPRARPGRCHERRAGALGRLTHTFYSRSLPQVPE